MFGIGKKNNVGMILNVSLSCSAMMQILNKEYDLTWDDIEDEDTSVVFQILDFGYDRYIINNNNKLSFYTGNTLLKKSFKVKPECCDKIFNKKQLNESSVGKSRRYMYMGYVGIEMSGITMSMLVFKDFMEVNQTISSFPLLEFIKMNNEGHKNYQNASRSDKEKFNAKDVSKILNNKWTVNERYVQDHPTVSFEEVCECPYEDYSLDNGLMDLRLKFEYSD